MSENTTYDLTSETPASETNGTTETQAPVATAPRKPAPPAKKGTPPVAGKKAAAPAPAKGGKTSAPASAAKLAAKAGKVSAPKEKTIKAAPGGRKKEGLRNAQVRILKFLARKPDQTFDRNQIAKEAPCDPASCVEYLGSHDPVKRAKNDEKHFLSLLTLGLVKAEIKSEDGTREKVRYKISATGKTAVAKA
jgi:hypothetical protein